MYTCAVLTISDKGSRKERQDISGQTIIEITEKLGYQIVQYDIVPDEADRIEEKLIQYADQKIPLILTTGGTGFSDRDVTPEATLRVATKLVPGIAEAIRAYSMTITRRAMLSRATSVIRDRSLIINLPGSPKACREILDFLSDSLYHGIQILVADASECAR